MDSKISLAILKGLSPRSREVLGRRFGLRGGKPETLEAIGQSFSITRERVRQIEEDGLRRAKLAMERKDVSLLAQKTYKEWTKHLKSYGGIRREEDFLAEIAAPKTVGHAIFLLTLGDGLEYVKENDNFYPAWACEKSAISLAGELVNRIVDGIGKIGAPISLPELFAWYKKEAQAGALTPKVFNSYISLSKNIKQGPHGLWGLQKWSEISPRGLRDRAYLVYKKEQRPLHFMEVTRLISAHGLAPEGRKILYQSVHNDLIRDPRFILIGRGIYALQEWGYEEGLVRDVILQLMQEAKRPMTVKEIIDLTLQQRQVKASTVLINLQNKNYFVKSPDGKYTIKAQGEGFVA